MIAKLFSLFYHNSLSSRERHQTKRFLSLHYGLLFILIFLGGSLRFHGLTFQSLWQDEVVTIAQSHPSKSPSAIFYYFQEKTIDPHPPLFFILLNRWFSVVGYSEFLARFLVFLGGICGLYALYMLAVELGGRRCGYIALILISVNYYHIYFSQEVRSYIFLFFGVTLSNVYFFRYLKNPITKNLILSISIIIVSIYLHFFSILVFLFQLAFLTGYLFIKRSLKYLMGLCASIVIVAIACSPLISTIIRHSERIQPSKSITFNFLVDMMNDFFGFQPILILIAVSAIIFVVIQYVRVLFNKEEDCDCPRDFKLIVPFLFSWFIICLVVPFFYGYFRGMNLLVRYEIIILPTLFCLISLGISLIKKRELLILITIFIVAISCYNIFYTLDYYNTVTKEQWRSVAELVVHSLRNSVNENDIYILSSVPDGFRIYLDFLGINKPILGPQSELYQDIIAGKLQDAKGFWFISGHWPPLQKFLSQIEQNHILVEEYAFRGAHAWYYVRQKELGTVMDCQ